MTRIASVCMFAEPSTLNNAVGSRIWVNGAVKALVRHRVEGAAF